MHERAVHALRLQGIDVDNITAQSAMDYSISNLNHWHSAGFYYALGRRDGGETIPVVGPDADHAGSAPLFADCYMLREAITRYWSKNMDHLGPDEFWRELVQTPKPGVRS